MCSVIYSQSYNRFSKFDIINVMESKTYQRRQDRALKLKQPGAAISIHDVARAAHVSQGTVSHVLNNTKTSVAISETTRQRVLSAVKELGYRPNPIARSLRTNRSYTIGVICNSPKNHWRNLCAIERLANQRGFDVLVALSRWELDREEAEIRRLLQRHVDGLIVLSPAVEPGTHDLMESLAERRFPIIGLGPMTAKGVDYVDIDRKSIYERMANHLLAQGCRRFVFFGTAPTPGVTARVDGVAAALAACADTTALSVIYFAERMAETGETEQSLVRAQLQAQKPDAVICVADLVALLAIRTAKTLGITIPKDMAITGGGNTDWGALIAPSLTTTLTNDEQLVARIMERLFLKIENHGMESQPFAELEPLELVIRESSLFGKDV